MFSIELESQILKKTKTGLTYVGGDRGTNMEHLACFSGNCSYHWCTKELTNIECTRMLNFKHQIFFIFTVRCNVWFSRI